MGGQSAQQQSGSQVYYDPQKGQYYTIQNPNQNQYSNPIANIFSGFLGGNDQRNYLGQSLTGTENPNRFTPQTVVPNYPDINQLFPALNAGLAQNLQNSLLAPTDTQSSGAGRFIAPSNTSQGK
jgi:hypothetical protein